MAYTKAQLEALKNSLLQSGQPITAAGQHRPIIQSLINEMFDAQSRGNLLADVQANSTTVAGDTVILIRSGQAYRVPATLFGGVGGTLVGLGDVVIVDPQDDDILSYDLATGKWNNIPLTGLFVTQVQLDAALDALQLPAGARLVSAELLITSTTAGTITSTWIDSLGQTENVTAFALTFNTAPAQVLPAAGNFRFDIIQGSDAGVVDAKQGVEAASVGVAIPAADAGKVVLSVVLWNDAGTSEVQQPGGGNVQQNDWQLLRQSTALAPNTLGKFAKVWEGALSKDGNYSIRLAYAEPKNAVNFDGSGMQSLDVSFTCNSSRVIIASTVQVTTGAGSTAGEFVLYLLSGNKAALYHKSNHYWGRIQYRVVFQNSQVRLADFTTNAPYAAAPAAVDTYTSTVEAGGGGVASVTGDGVNNTDPANPVITQAGGGSVLIAFSTVINMDGNYKSTHTQTGAIAIAKGSFPTPATNFENKTVQLIAANGTGGKPTFTADFVVQMDTWSNNTGDINQLIYKGSPSGKILVWMDNVELT